MARHAFLGARAQGQAFSQAQRERHPDTGGGQADANESFKQYFETMLWLAMPFSARELKDKLSRKLNVSGIPTLVVRDASSSTLCSGRGGREVSGFAQAGSGS
jgi:hypothetical protein